MFRRKKRRDEWHDHLPDRLPRDTLVAPIKVHPMALFLTSLFFGWAVDALTRWRLGGGSIRIWLAVAVMIGGLALMMWAIQQYRRAATSPDVKHKPEALVTTGPYRFSRNPMYLAFCGVVAGLAVALNLPGAVIALVPAAIVLHYKVVLIEEGFLRGMFGAEFDDYCRRTRRWL
ncbi:MAG: isoprenylcysteine carboxylmethyltransferase family protein [Alphaproteobacteria bacterium]|nr:isoprenylcysteine carboxylmethyltransferase family protein [Alphaproteobacteria bacterium]